MTRVLLLGDGGSVEMLRQLLSDRGVDVMVTPDATHNGEGAAYDASIDVERLCTELDAVVLGSTSTPVPRGLLATGLVESMRRTFPAEAVAVPPANARPYLKRKKGRDVASLGISSRSSHNSVAKHRNRA